MEHLSKTISPAGGEDPSGSVNQWLAASNQWLAALLWRGSWIVAALAFTVVFFRVAAHFELGVLWDDAYIFQRYALNLQNGHGWAWQPGGEPTYGTTSLAFVVPVILLQALTHNAALSAMLASVLGGVLFIAVMLFALRRLRASPAVRMIGSLGLLVCCAWSGLPAHFVTGMDTTWALAYLAGYLWLLQRLEQRGRGRDALWIGIMGGLGLAMRPDLLAFTVVIPATWLVLTRDRKLRRRLVLALGLSLGVIAMQLAFNSWYFQSALPLPFYAKSTRLYGGSLRNVYRGVSTENLLHFLAGCWPLALLLLLDVVAGPRQWWRKSEPLDKAAMCATLIFGGYYWLVALPVMSMEQRFLQPLLPLLAWLATRTAMRWEAQHGASLRADATGRWGISLAGGIGLMMVLVMLWPHITNHGTAFVRFVAHGHAVFDIHEHSKKSGPRGYWYQLDGVSALPDDVIIATTEVGFIGALNPNKQIIDMAGLNERAFAHQPFAAERLLEDLRPDFIYMPHVDYKAMRQELIESDAFAGYDYYPYKQLRTRAFGVAIRRDSPHYDKMRALLPGAPRQKAKPGPRDLGKSRFRGHTAQGQAR